ncbi:type II toxin-antitoxin system VapC family toxin [Cyanobacteria bacterium FACHB-DQ100]|nr:type II toxin-antitoxin system VapC family toxin [Cyanobacteria bacterium FACHB-DQ100]
MSYLDTSIIVPAYCTEPLSDRVDEVLLREAELAISNLTEVEFYSALSRKVREQQLTLDEAQQISIDFQADLDARIYQRLQIEAVHYQLAQDWIRRFDTKLRTLDALHLAIAHESSMTITTGDVGLAQSGQILGLNVELIVL